MFMGDDNKDTILDLAKANVILDHWVKGYEPEFYYFPYDVNVNGVEIKAGSMLQFEKNKFPVTRPNDGR